MSSLAFRTSAPSEWTAAPDLRAAVEEALERSIWLREAAQAQAARITAALGVDWRPAELAPAGDWLLSVPAVHLELLEPLAGYAPGALLCRRALAPGSVLALAQRADGNAEAYEAGITCKACLKALARLSPTYAHR